MKNYYAFGYVFDEQVEFIDGTIVYDSYENALYDAQRYLEDYLNVEDSEAVIIMKVKPVAKLTKKVMTVFEETTNF